MTNKIPLSYISPDPNQPRKLFDADKLSTLKNSIKEYGIINPLGVEKISDKKYLLVDGERRFRAASELGIKEVPVNILPPSDELNRLVRQFHIQEQQEGWTATEKASVVDKLSRELGMEVQKACQLLGIPKRTGLLYIAFSKLAEKEIFMKHDISIKYSEPLIATREFIKKLKKENEDHTITRTEEKLIEKRLISKIISGEIEKPMGFTKIKDSIKADYKMIDVLMENKMSIDQMFAKSKGKSHYHLRNLLYTLSWIENHINYLKENPVKIDSLGVSLTKRVSKRLKDFADSLD